MLIRRPIRGRSHRTALNSEQAADAEASSALFRWTLILIVLSVLAAGVYFARRSGGDYKRYSNDFNVYYFASTEILSGRDPYQNRLGQYTPYLYPPFLAEALIPLALLPLPIAAYLWFLANAVALAGCAVMSANLVVPGSDKTLENSSPAQADLSNNGETHNATIRRAVAFLAILIVSRFAVDCFNMGQVNAIVAALAVAHVYLYENKRPGWSVVALAAAAVIKLSPVLILGYHLAKGRLKFVLLCGALMGALGLGCFLPFGGRSVPAFHAFWTQTVQNGQGFDLAYAGNQSIRGAVARLEHEQGTVEGRITDKPESIAIAILLAALALFSARRARSEAQAAAPFLCLPPLLSPLSWKGHFLILLMPCAMILAVGALSASRLHRMTAVGISFLAFLGFTVTSSLIVGVQGAEWSDSHSLILIAALLVYFAVSVFSPDPLRRVHGIQ